jgi:hypothetical protein
MAKIRSGGGITSNKLKQDRLSKAEPRSRAISPEAADQLGQATSFKKPPLDMGRGYQPVGPTDNVKAVGVGGGRTVMRCGSQNLHGPVNRGHSPAARDILSEFGPEKRKG